MLARLNTRGGVFGMEVRRRLDDHRVELLLQQLAIGGEPGVAVGGWHVELRPRLIRVVREIIRHRHEIVAPVLQEQVGNPLPAAPTANQPDIDL